MHLISVSSECPIPFRLVAVNLTVLRTAFLDILMEDRSIFQNLPPKARRYSEVKAATTRNKLNFLSNETYPKSYAQSTGSIERKRTKEGSVGSLGSKKSLRSTQVEGDRPIEARMDASVPIEAKNRAIKRGRSGSHMDVGQPSSLPPGKRRLFANR